MQQEIPHPPEAGIVNALRFGSDPFRFLEGMQARFEDIVSVPIPGRAPLVIVTNPELIHEALSRPAAFSRVPAQGPAALIANQGLVQSEGALWRQQRSIMGPAFRGKQVTAYANTVDELATEWREPDTKETRNLHEEMTAMTIRVASEILQVRISAASEQKSSMNGCTLQGLNSSFRRLLSARTGFHSRSPRSLNGLQKGFAH
ncbi:cytochrome P450 [Halalkalicoccus salilacus]|uniref:cytochrome P450 n=1 Tax=Halalkalicoccus sp. GCM10025704 TaxID=3252662 RepID=UPI00361CE364